MAQYLHGRSGQPRVTVDEMQKNRDNYAPSPFQFISHNFSICKKMIVVLIETFQSIVTPIIHGTRPWQMPL